MPGHGFFEGSPPRVLAHRGLALDAPENTMLAFAKALAAGASHIETDVRVTADGHAVIAHDPDLSRVADRSVEVGRLTLAELRRVDLGHGQGFAGLAEALDGLPDARFNIDLKDAGVVLPAVAAVREARAQDRVLLTSFSEARRKAAVAALPAVATSVASSTALRVLAAHRAGLRGAARRALGRFHAVQLPERWKGVTLVTPRFVELAHSAGVEVHVWTVNDPVEMNRLLDLGVDGIVTDRADLAVEVVGHRPQTGKQL